MGMLNNALINLPQTCLFTVLYVTRTTHNLASSRNNCNMSFDSTNEESDPRFRTRQLVRVAWFVLCFQILMIDQFALALKIYADCTLIWTSKQSSDLPIKDT